MADVYDNPGLTGEDEDDFIKFEQVGDDVQGTVLDITVVPTKFTPDGVLKYGVKLDSTGREASFLAGSKNLKGQLMTLRPRPGDHLDIRLIELRPTQMGSPLKVFEVKMTPAGKLADPVPAQVPAAGADDDTDLFAS